MMDDRSEPARSVEIDGRRVGPGHSTFIIGEVGSNHNADLSMARRLIEVAAEAGVDAVKFQLFRSDWLYPPDCGTVETPMGMADFIDVLDQCTLPPEWIGELVMLAKHLAVVFLCTAFDEQALQRLAELDVAAVKIASPELNHLPLLRASARLHKPLLCSTGLCTLGEIEEALGVIRSEWPAPEIALLQCVSSYPLPEEQSNLRAIETLHRAFGIPVGLSDHTTDFEAVPAVAVASGAALIEKHFTLSRTLPGVDHSFALEPNELRCMVATIRSLERVDPDDRWGWIRRHWPESRVEALRGHGRKEIMDAERPLYPNDKRSIHAIRPIAEGERLSEENVRVLRSERNLTPGLHSRHWETVMGARARSPLRRSEGLRWDHLIDR
jgi:N-acetylneuraminate synthase